MQRFKNISHILTYYIVYFHESNCYKPWMRPSEGRMHRQNTQFGWSYSVKVFQWRQGKFINKNHCTWGKEGNKTKTKKWNRKRLNLREKKQTHHRANQQGTQGKEWTVFHEDTQEEMTYERLCRSGAAPPGWRENYRKERRVRTKPPLTNRRRAPNCNNNLTLETQRIFCSVGCEKQCLCFCYIAFRRVGLSFKL